MSFKEDSSGRKTPLESDDSSEGEAYDDSSYGSDIQPPDLGTGFVMVHENCCRARYRPSRVAKDAPYYVCLNKSGCRSLAGGNHAVLRGGHRAEPGVYEGVYGSSGKLTAAKSGSMLPTSSVAKLAADKRAADRAHASLIGGLLDDVSPPQSVIPNQERASDRTQGRSTSDVSPFSISEADKLISPAIDQTVEGQNSGGMGGDPKHDQNAILLKLMSSLCQKIEDLGSGIEKGNTTILQALQGTETEPRAKPSALRSSSHSTAAIDERTAVSSTAQKYARAVRKGETQLDEGEEENNDETEEEDDGWPCDDPEWGPYDPTRRSSKGNRKSSSSQRTRLYAIAKGKGGQQSIGLYRENWDTIEFLVRKESNSRYKKVRNEKEGVAFIKSFLRSKGLHKPKWLKEGKVYYPRVSALRRQFEEYSEDDQSSSDSGYSTEESTPKKTKNSTPKEKSSRGVDESMGKDHELFGVDVKSVAGLERGIAPSNLGKQTISLFLEQIDDMTAYPRHTHHKTSESLGDFVEAVTDLSNQSQGKQGGGPRHRLET